LSEINQELDRYKKVVLKALLKLTSIAGMVFPIINFQRGLYLFAFIELLTIIILIAIYFGVKNTEDQNKIELYSLAYTVLFLSVLMLAFTMTGISKSIFIWTFTIPMISYLLLGIRKGFYVTAIYYLISSILLLNNFDYNTLDAITMANICIAAIGFWVLAHIYENANFITKRKLKNLAIYDSLTGLHNRTMLNKIFNEKVSIALDNNKLIGFISFDLDCFKDINDQYGHVVGDIVLVDFAKILSQFTPKNATSFRLGGEEFAIIYLCENSKQVVDLAEKIRRHLENIPIEANNQTIKTTVSAGVAIDNPDNVEITNIFNQSDERLYKAKKLGRNRVIFQ